MREFEMKLDENNEELGVYALSIVDDPAIQVGFVALKSEDKRNLSLAKVDEDKKILIGAALIPEKRILRVDDESGEAFNIYFSSETVEKTAHLFLKNNAHHNGTDMHDGKNLDGLTVVESWIKEDEKLDKSSKYGFDDLPVGTWFVTMKVDNDEEWAKIKSGEREGFSIEGHFTQELSMKANEIDLGLMLDLMDKVLDLQQNK